MRFCGSSGSGGICENGSGNRNCSEWLRGGNWRDRRDGDWDGYRWR